MGVLFARCYVINELFRAQSEGTIHVVLNSPSMCLQCIHLAFMELCCIISTDTVSVSLTHPLCSLEGAEPTDSSPSALTSTGVVFDVCSTTR